MRVAATVGPFAVRRIVSNGLRTRVYEAVGHHGNLVALKVLHPSLASRAEPQLAISDEIRALSRVSSPRIPRLVDAGEFRGVPWLATNWIYPASRVDVEKLAGDPSLMTRWTLDVVAAVSAIHETEMLHGDLFPRNLIVDAEGRMNLLDLGSVTPRARFASDRDWEVAKADECLGIEAAVRQFATGTTP